MPELSNLLRQRLGAAKDSAGEHPDADTLTAFTERALPAAERQKLLAHLSACAECREIIALSQPELAAPATQPVFTPAPVPAWRRWFSPAFGLAASVAAVAVVAVMVLQHPQKLTPPANQQAQSAPLSQPDRASQSNNTASQPSAADQKAVDQKALDQASGQNAAPAIVAENAAPPPPPDSFTGAQTGPASHLKARSEALAPVVTGKQGSGASSVVPARTAAAAVPLQPALRAGLRKQDYLNNAFFETSNADVVTSGAGNNMPSASKPQGLSTEAKLSANAPGQITIFSDIPSGVGSKPNVRMLTPPPSPERFGCTVCKMVTAGARTVFRRTPSTAPAISSNALTFSAMGSSKFSADVQKGQPSEAVAAPEKSEAAGLERTDALSGRAMSSGPASSQLPAAWRVIGGKLLKSAGTQWEEAYPAASFQFTFVNAHAGEIWAGGSHAALIHSRDDGATWETSRLGETASGSIVSILFLGSNVQVKTSDEQSWSSSDGGKTWTQN